MKGSGKKKEGKYVTKVFDGHCDTISHCYHKGIGLRRNEGHLDLERTEKYAGWAQFFAIFASQKWEKDPLWQVTQRQYAVFCRELERNADLVIQCRTAAEVVKAWESGKTAALLSIEGAELLDCDPDKLETVYGWGVRAINLTWNHTNDLSGTNAEDKEKGLSEKGKAFAHKMQDLGMLVDVSHLSDPGFWDVMDLAKKPIWASHSNSRAVCPHSRNLTNEQFKALIKNGGVAGLNMCDEFVGEEPTIDGVVAHVEHWFGLGGEKNVSLGGDWDGISGMPAGINGVQDLEKLAERLLKMNYGEEQVNGIFYQNLLRVVREVCIM